MRIDAVVTDRDGRIVSDLTAEDFEVRQDGKQQTVTFAQFMPVLVAEPREAARTRVVAPAGSPVEAAALPPVPVKREAVQRTLAIVVDDLSLSVESFQNAQRALHTFVDRELQPTDLVALVRTGGSSGALQSFTTDRRVLHAAIDGLRWNGASRNGVEAFEAVNQWTTFDERTGMAPSDDFRTITQLRNSMSAAGTLGALNLAIQGTRDLPGRKAIIFVSEGFQLMVRETNDATRLPNARLRYSVDRVIDQATRAGVVIYSLDSRGLQTGGLQAADNLKSTRPGQTMDAGRPSVRQRPVRVQPRHAGGHGLSGRADRRVRRLEYQRSGSWTRPHHRDLRGYYVIGYVPEDGTFAAKGKTARFRKIAINVKRAGPPREDAQGVPRHQRSAGDGRSDDSRGAARARGDLALRGNRHRAPRDGACRHSRPTRACSCARCCTSTRVP